MDAAILNISCTHGTVHLIEQLYDFTVEDEVYCCQETTHAFAFTTLPKNRARVFITRCALYDSRLHGTFH